MKLARAILVIVVTTIIMYQGAAFAVGGKSKGTKLSIKDCGAVGALAFEFAKARNRGVSRAQAEEVARTEPLGTASDDPRVVANSRQFVLTVVDGVYKDSNTDPTQVGEDAARVCVSSFPKHHARNAVSMSPSEYKTKLSASLTSTLPAMNGMSDACDGAHLAACQSAIGDAQVAVQRVSREVNGLAPPSCLMEADREVRASLKTWRLALAISRQGIDARNADEMERGGSLMPSGNAHMHRAIDLIESSASDCSPG
jgi:hypothetical protein